MSKIKQIIAREVLDSRGDPTVEAEVFLESGIRACAQVPSGASTGKYEAWELRDGDRNRYGGKGVLCVVKNIIEKINPLLQGFEVTSQREIDEAMIKLDGSENKKNLGANAILAVSLACARAGSILKKQELYQYLAETYDFDTKNYKMPTPSFNIFNGGKHADTNLDFQEFMILPLTNISFAEKVRMGSEIFHELGKVLREAGLDTDLGNEGGYAPDIHSSIDAIEYIMAAGVRMKYNPGKDFGIGIDVAATELFDNGSGEYIFKLDNAHFKKDTLIGLYNEWFRKYPIISIEDGFSEDDWKSWADFNREMGSEMLIIGDDLYTTNINRLRIGLKEKASNAILIKLNQVGTLSETIDCIKLAQRHNHKIMISHRSGETCDDFIADLAVAVGAEYIKSGSTARSERLAKYNRLMKIEELL